MHAHTPVQAVNIWAVFTVTSYRASLFSLSNSHKKPQHCVTRPQIWNVCRTNSDVVTWFTDYLFSLLTVNIFLPALSLGSSGPETLGFATALWDPMQNHTENHLWLHSQWWESRRCCTPVLRDTQTPWGVGIEALRRRLWKAPWQTGKMCWLLCSEVHAVGEEANGDQRNKVKTRGWLMSK